MKKLFTLLMLTCMVCASIYAEPTKITGADNSVITEGWYLVQVGTNGNGYSNYHSTYRGEYICGDKATSDWGLRLTTGYNNDLNYIYITKNGTSFLMEFLHGTSNAWKIGYNCKISESIKNLTITPSEQTADNDQWKIWGNGSQRWMGWYLDNRHSVGSTGTNNTDYNACSWTFYRVNENEVPLARQTLQEKIASIYNTKKGCVGYPINMEGLVTYINNVTTDNYNTAKETLATLYTSTNVNKPVPGKAYYIKNVHPSGKVYAFKQDGENVLQLVNTNETALDESSVYVYYVSSSSDATYQDGFVNAKTGKFLIWKGHDSGFALNSNKGYIDTYDSRACGMRISKPSGAATEDKFGLLTFGGKRQSGKADPCFIITEAGVFNAHQLDYVWYDNSYSTLFSFEEVPNENTIKLTNPNKDAEKQTLLDQRYVGTFSAPYAVQLPNEVEAYIATIDNDVVTFAKLGNDGHIVPKNTGVLLYAPDATQNITVSAVPAISTVTIEDGTNAFVGSNAGSVVMLSGFYVLGKRDAGVGFYPAVVESTLARNKAYLNLSQHPQVSAFKFDFEDEGITTAISSALGLDQKNESVAYDLAGRRCNIGAKGISIVGGKKVIR